MSSDVNPYFLHLNTQCVLKFGNFDDEADTLLAQHRVKHRVNDVQNVPAGDDSVRDFLGENQERGLYVQ